MYQHYSIITIILLSDRVNFTFCYFNTNDGLSDLFQSTSIISYIFHFLPLPRLPLFFGLFCDAFSRGDSCGGGSTGDSSSCVRRVSSCRTISSCTSCATSSCTSCAGGGRDVKAIFFLFR
jgi:hypothetical protein